MATKSWLVCEGMHELCLVVAVPPQTDDYSGREPAVTAYITQMRDLGFFVQRWTIDAEACPVMDNLTPTPYTLLALGVLKKLSSGCASCGRMIYADTDDEGKRMIYAMTDDGQAGVDVIKDEETGYVFCTDTCHQFFRDTHGEQTLAPDVALPAHDLADHLYPTYNILRERELAQRSQSPG